MIENGSREKFEGMCVNPFLKSQYDEDCIIDIFVKVISLIIMKGSKYKLYKLNVNMLNVLEIGRLYFKADYETMEKTTGNS